jgi:hypothetical protein
VFLEKHDKFSSLLHDSEARIDHSHFMFDRTQQRNESSGGDAVPRPFDLESFETASSSTVEATDSNLAKQQDMALELLRQRHLNEELAARLEAIKISNEVTNAMF